METFSSAYSNGSNTGFLQDFENEITVPSNFLSDYPSNYPPKANGDLFEFADNFEDFSRAENADFFEEQPRFSRVPSDSPLGWRREDADENGYSGKQKQDFPTPLYPTKAVRLVRPTTHFFPTAQTTRAPIRYSEPLRYLTKGL